MTNQQQQIIHVFGKVSGNPATPPKEPVPCPPGFHYDQTTNSFVQDPVAPPVGICPPLVQPTATVIYDTPFNVVDSEGKRRHSAQWLIVRPSDGCMMCVKVTEDEKNNHLICVSQLSKTGAYKEFPMVPFHIAETQKQPTVPIRGFRDNDTLGFFASPANTPEQPWTALTVQWYGLTDSAIKRGPPFTADDIAIVGGANVTLYEGFPVSDERICLVGMERGLRATFSNLQGRFSLGQTAGGDNEIPIDTNVESPCSDIYSKETSNVIQAITDNSGTMIDGTLTA